MQEPAERAGARRALQFLALVILKRTAVAVHLHWICLIGDMLMDCHVTSLSPQIVLEPV